MDQLLFSPAHFPEGSYVRAYDFPGNVRCYVEGELVGYQRMDGCMRYLIRPTRVVWDGKVERNFTRDIVYPPVNGTPTFRGQCCSVALLDKPYHHWLDDTIAEQAAAYNLTPEQYAKRSRAAARLQEYVEASGEDDI